jgi:YggT family protein
MNLISVIDWAFQIYYILIIVYVLLSWVPNARSSPVGTLLEKLVEPYLSVFRRLIPPLGMIDLSPVVALFALHFVKLGLFTVLDWVLGG